MTTHDLQSKPKPAGIGYSMVFPPGWREFKTTVEFEDVLAKLVVAEAKALGRADVVLMLRKKTHEMFENLRRRGALEFAIPVDQLSGGVWPVSLIVTPLKTGPTGSLMKAVGRVAGGNSIEAQVVDDATWYAWNTTTRFEETQGFQNHGLNLVVPRPLQDGSVDPDPKTGLWLLFSYGQMDGAESSDTVEQLRELGLAILGTFKWVAMK